MKDITIVDATTVEVYNDEYTEDYSVGGIYFAERNQAECGGEHWNFSRSSVIEKGFERVCTVKEIQQTTLYGDIVEFRVERKTVFCEFTDKGAIVTGVKKLKFNFDINEDEWDYLCDMAEWMFKGNTALSIQQP